MDWGTIAWKIFLCLLLAFILGFILGWLLRWLFGKDRTAKLEADLNAKDNELRGLRGKATVSADAGELASLKASLSACRDETSGLKGKISGLEGELSDSKSKLAAAATTGAIGGGIAAATLKSSSGDADWNTDYGTIKARLDELEVLATDDEEDTDEELQAWTAEGESLRAKIATLKGRANTDDERTRVDGLDASAISLLAILRDSRTDKAAGIAKLRRKGYALGVRDDLKEILGVGPVLEKMLNGLDVYTFRDIATWNDAKIDEVSTHLESFQDRIRREDWVGQCKELHFKKYDERV